MFARQSSAKGYDQVRRFFHEAAELFYSLDRLQIEVHAIVYAAVAEVAVHQAEIPIRIGELAECPQVNPKLLRRNRRVFPPFPGRWFPRDVRDGTQRGFAHLPDSPCLLLVGEQ